MKKRFLSILMALCMMLTLAVPSVAAGDTVDPPIDETSVTQETGGGTEGQEPPETPETPETPEDSTPPASPEDAGGPEEGGETGDPSSGGEGSVPPAEEPPINADDFTITPGMTQEQVDAAVDAAEGVITIQVGNYGIDGEMNHIKINLDNGNQTVQLEENGSYNRLMFVVLTEGNTLIGNGATIYGDVSTVFNQSPAIYIPYGSLNLNGNLTIDDHDYGVILGFTNGTADKAAELCIAENARLEIVNCKSIESVSGNSSYDNGVVCAGTDYFSYVDTQVDGTRGSGITTKGKGYTKVTVSESAELNITDCTGSAIYSIDVSNFTLDIQKDAKVNLKSNAQGLNMNTDYSGSIDVIVDHAKLEITNNRSNGITGQAKPYLLNVKNQSTVTVDNNGSMGINNFFIKVEDSKLSVSNNGSHGASNVALDAENSTIVCSGNDYIGLNITKYNQDKTSTEIKNSTVTANGNGGSGIRFYIGAGKTNITDSKIYTHENGAGTETYGYAVKPGDSGYWAGLVGKGSVTLTNSYVSSDSAGGYALYNDSAAPATLNISGTDVVAFDATEGMSNADIFDDWNSKGNTGRTYVTGGSLQAEFQQMTTRFTHSLNQKIPAVGGTTEKAEVQYAAPVNANSTALTRFDLHQDKNSVVGGDEDSYSFNVWDPNGGSYQYTFRYNTAEEDLTDVGGNAYVWTPVTVIHYDATEGAVALEGSTAEAGDVVLNNTRGDGSPVGNQPVMGENSYIDATDYTICGNSLALSEGTLPTATRDGYVFGGWYYAIGKDDISQAAQYASEGNYNDLYTLLKEHGARLESTTLTSKDGEDLSNITVYAVWEEAVISIKPVDLTVYMGGDDGYEAVVGDGTTIGTSSNSLPQPIFTLQASDGTENLNGLQFKSGKKTWTAQMIPNVDETPSDYYTLTAAEGQDPVRVTYTGEDEIPHISDSFEIIQEGDVFTTYEIALYTNQVEIGSVTATLNGKTYSVDASQTGTLTVRAVEDTEDNAAVSPVVNEAPPERLESGTGLIVAEPDTQYTVNNLGIPVPAGSAPSLLFDSIITNDGIDRETRLEQEVAEQLPALGQYQTRHYQSQYLDLVDANNGNIWLKANQAITVYWAYPQGTDANDDFTLWHFKGLHREGENSGFEIGDVEAAQLEQVTIQKDAYGISFTVEPGGFSPFVLTWTEYDRPPVDPNPDPDPDPTPDPDPEDPDKPELNTEDHYAYIVGYPDGNVKPEGNITRAEVATIFFRLLTDESRDEFWSQTNNYSDVSEDAWYNNAVSTLTNAGILDGYEDGTFKPDGNITRAEFATIAVRFFEATYDGGDLFSDIAGHWAQDYINEAANAGIVDGYPDGTFGPQKLITRAEAMTMVNRTIDRHPHEDHLLDDMIVWPDNPETAWYYEQVQEATNSHEYTMNTDDEQNPYEIWTELLPVRDWAQLEKEWSDAHSGQSGGDVV